MLVQTLVSVLISISYHIPSSDGAKTLLTSPIASAVCGQWANFKETKEIQEDLKHLPADIPILKECDNWLWDPCRKPGEKGCTNKVEHSPCSASDQRVIGGERARVDEFPWDVSIRFIYDWGSFYPEPRKSEDVLANDFKGLREAHRCTGTLYSRKYVITSAWCAERAQEYITSKNRFVLWISRGRFLNAQFIEKAKGKKKAKGRIIEHPDFDPNKFTDHEKDHDIALLEVPKPFKFTKYIYALEIGPPEKDFTGLRAVFTGWGTTTAAITETMLGAYGKRKEAYGSALFKLELTMMPFAGECEEVVRSYLEVQPNYNPDEDLQSRYVCAQADNPEAQGACGGDLGGPLICSEGDKRYFCGIRNSWGIAQECPTPDNIEIFLRPSYYLPWIESVAGKQIPEQLKPKPK